MKKFLISLPIDAVVPGGVYGTLPSHCTVLQPFETKRTAEDITYAVKQVCRNTRPLELNAAGRELFGPDCDVPVTMLERTPALVNLHLEVTTAIEHEGGKILDPEWAKDGYRPYVSDFHGRRYSGQGYLADKLAVIEFFPNRVKRVVAIVPLDEWLL